MTFMKDPVLRVVGDLLFAFINGLLFASACMTELDFGWGLLALACATYFLADALYIIIFDKR